MGYRALLKKYIRYLTRHIGDRHIDELVAEGESGLSRRDVAELRSLIAEIRREDRHTERERNDVALGRALPQGAPPRPG